jgi:hypothetical protein
MNPHPKNAQITLQIEAIATNREKALEVGGYGASGHSTAWRSKGACL